MSTPARGPKCPSAMAYAILGMPDPCPCPCPCPCHVEKALGFGIHYSIGFGLLLPSTLAHDLVRHISPLPRGCIQHPHGASTEDARDT